MKAETDKDKNWKTILTVVGGKGGTGKTTVMAHLADQLELGGISFRAYDFESLDGTGLARFYEKAKKLKLMEFDEKSDLDAVFNDLVETDSNGPQFSLVDFPANAWDSFFKWVTALDWAGLKEEKIRLVFLLVLSDDGDSFALAAPWIEELGAKVKYAVVLNKGQGRTFAMYTRTPAGMTFKNKHQPLEIEFPEISTENMLHLRNEGTTMIRAFDPVSKKVMAPGLPDKFMDKARIKTAREDVIRALQPLVDLITSTK